MKKVLIIRSNPVRPDSRVEKEALSLKKAGYDVRILAWDRDSDHKPINEEIIVGDTVIPITRLGFKASFGEGIKNIKQYLQFQFSMRKYLKMNPFDIIHACDFDTAFFSYRLVKRKKELFIFDIFDFIGGERKNIKQKLLGKLQYNIINTADATIICTEDRKKQIEGSKPKNLTIIHNAPSFEQVICKGDINSIGNKIRICYVGILQNGRLLREIGQSLSDKSEIELHVGGFGILDQYFIDLANKHPNIKYYGRLPYDKTLELEKTCDIILAIYDPSVENHVFAAPNKFYEGLMLGKPLIMVKGTGMSDLVLKYNIGVLIDYSKEGFEQGLDCLIHHKSDWPNMANKMKELYNEHYSWDIMSERLISLYHSVEGL